LIQTWSQKYLERAGIAQAVGLGMHIWDFKTWHAITEHYMVGYGWFLINLMYIYLIKKCFLEKVRHGTVERAVLFLCLWPVLLHHLVFLNFTGVHEFSVLKTGFLIALLTALIYSKIDHYLFRKWGAELSQVLRTQGLLIVFCLMTLLSVNSYFETYKLFEFQKQAAARVVAMGKKIASVADRQEVIFLEPKFVEISLPLVFYAHRNITGWTNDQDAMKFLKRTGAKRGVIVAFDGRGQLVRETHINVDEGGK
jgi:hypothetical protein